MNRCCERDLLDDPGRVTDLTPEERRTARLKAAVLPAVLDACPAAVSASARVEARPRKTDC
jgi:hypothetical protein